jgi:thymidylate synthase (FAD)
MASFSVQSQRYVRENQFEYVTPPEIAEIPEALELFREAMEADQKYYDSIAAVLKEKHIKTFMAEGMDEKAAIRAAEKKAIEDARFVLPNACDTKMIVTMNARSLHNFFRHRCCNRAQWEIRDVADQMLSLCSSVAPHLFKKLHKSTISGSLAALIIVVVPSDTLAKSTVFSVAPTLGKVSVIFDPFNFSGIVQTS